LLADLTKCGATTADSFESDSVDGVSKSILLETILSHKFLHASLADSLSIEDLEESLELVFLGVLSVANEDHLLGALFLSEVNQVKVSGFSEPIDRYFSHPNEELLTSLVEDAREAPAGLRPGEAYL